MSNSNSDKKQPNKKPNSSYSLLIQGIKEVQKTKPTNKNSNLPKKTKDRTSESRGSPHSTMNSTNNDHQEKPSSSSNKVSEDPDVPDRSYGDYFCKVCDSHMNSDGMWEAHITGKRHIKNVKKGDTDSKYEDLPDVESSIKYELRNVKDPIVGLSYIHEIRRKEPNVPPIYNCFLCHASIATVPLVTEHVISMKHRLNYIKENNPDEYELIEATNLKKGHMEPLVLEAARTMEQQVGRGTVKVKQEKKKDPVATWGVNTHKKSFNKNEDFYADDRYHKPYPKNPNFEELGPRPDVWKSVDIEKNYGRRERSRSPRDARAFISRSRSRSPRDYREESRMYSGDEHSMDGYKRSFSNRDRSPSPHRDSYEKHRSFSRRDVSPEDNYRSSRSKTDDYLQPMRKSDTHVRLDYIPPRCEPENRRETLKELLMYASRNHQNSASLRPQERFSPPPQTSSRQPRSIKAILDDTYLLTSDECYKLFYERLKSLPEISSIPEILSLTKLISEAQKKLRNKLSEELLSNLMDLTTKSDTTTNICPPGLGNVMSSPASSQHIRTDNSQKASDTAKFFNEIFKSANISPKMPTYAPAINLQPPVQGNAYERPVATYQTLPPASTYQGTSSSSYTNQAPYQRPNTNVPFGPSSIPGIPGLGATENATPQVFNYSHFSSASSASKNYPHQY